MVIRVQANSPHGKIRIREHGDLWQVVRTVERCACKDNRKAHLVVPVGQQLPDGWWRWVAVHQDKDFEICIVSP